MSRQSPHDDPLVAWTRSHYAEAARSTRALSELAAELGGALTTGQAAFRDVHVGAPFKYELEDGRFLASLRRFVRGALSAEWTSRSPELANAEAALYAAIAFFDDNERAISSATYREPGIVIEARRLARDAAARLEAIIDQAVMCVFSEYS